MAKQYSVGDRVLCRFYNSAERKSYGTPFKAVITDIQDDERMSERNILFVKRHFIVKRLGDSLRVSVWRREIVRRLKDEE